MKPIYVRMVDAPALFSIGLTTIYEMSYRGEIKIHKRGATSLIKVEEMERAIEGKPPLTVGPDVSMVPR